MVPAHIIRPDTVQALKSYMGDRQQPLRKWGAELGVPYMLVYHVWHGHTGKVSLESENWLRRVLGRPPIGQHIIEDCPDCGGLHPRCWGKKLAPPKPKVLRYWRNLPLNQLAAAIQKRVPYEPT